MILNSLLLESFTNEGNAMASLDLKLLRRYRISYHLYQLQTSPENLLLQGINIFVGQAMSFALFRVQNKRSNKNGCPNVP